MADLAADIKKLRFDLEHDSNENKTVRLETETGENETVLQEAGGGNRTADKQGPQTTANISGSGKTNWIKAAGGFGLAAIVIFAGWYFLADRLFSKIAPFEKIRIEEVATDVRSPGSISPDGKLFAFVRTERGASDGRGKQKLIVKKIDSPGENAVFETQTANLTVYFFSPDGEFIYFSKNEGGNSSFNRIPSIGGNPMKMFDNKDYSSLAISPDGQRLTYLSSSKKGEGRAVFISGIDGSKPEELVRLSEIGALYFPSPSWSSDSRKLAFLYTRQTGTSPKIVVGVYDLESGEKAERLKIINGDLPFDRLFSGVSWVGNDSGMVMVARSDFTRYQVWYVSYPDGKLRQITNDTNNYGGLSISADGTRIITQNRSDSVSFWTVALDTEKVTQIRPDNRTLLPGSFSVSADNGIYFLKYGGVGINIFSMNEDGTDEKEVKADNRWRNEVAVTPDGKHLISSIWGMKQGGRGLYRMNRDGSGESQLTDLFQGGEEDVQFIPGDIIIFNRRTWEKGSQIMTVPVTGGKAEEIELEPAFSLANPRISSDGKYLAYEAEIKDEKNGESKWFVRVVRFKDGKAGEKVLEKEIHVSNIRWVPGSDAIAYTKHNEPYNIFRFDLGGEEETQITDFNKNANVGDFHFSNDGTKIFVTRAVSNSNVVLIRDIMSNAE
jgi:Tol biopolymer transport system component